MDFGILLRSCKKYPGYVGEVALWEVSTTYKSDVESELLSDLLKVIYFSG
jgi:hypothetical protein